MTDHGYVEDSEEHYASPHVHRCMDCGGWMIYHDLDNTTCKHCRDGVRPCCHGCIVQSIEAFTQGGA